MIRKKSVWLFVGLLVGWLIADMVYVAVIGDYGVGTLISMIGICCTLPFAIYLYLVYGKNYKRDGVKE